MWLKGEAIACTMDFPLEGTQNTADLFEDTSPRQVGVRMPAVNLKSGRPSNEEPTGTKPYELTVACNILRYPSCKPR